MLLTTSFRAPANPDPSVISNVEPRLRTCKKVVESMPASHQPVDIESVLASLSRNSSNSIDKHIAITV